MTALCELRISLKRPWPYSAKCMSPASERYLLRPLADEQLRRTKLPFLRVFEVRVDWEEGLEEHMWNEKGLWPAPIKKLLSLPLPLPLPGSETEMQEMHEAREPEMEVEDMWRPGAFLLERGSRAEFLAREGWEVWRDEQWDSYLVKEKKGGEEEEDDDDEDDEEEEEEEKEEEEDGDDDGEYGYGYGNGNGNGKGKGAGKRAKLWQNAAFTVIRSFDEV
ncbi:hypothetical protein EMCG_06376 [[Emmonsia] crescens]|uniref:Uncharacterized protein n=1 Tax=[Emmonsia] crescens TaxID=73230 RepID=A0A0G2JBR8_9EURO|nr:hypothetical protein EMCG_06376 [Emmonsia crescens UAMH 3008]